jgi:membrane associated rhomboid family serine protease
LRNIFVIVILQLAFDVVTPHVSMSAHLGGLFTGFLLGLLVPAAYSREEGAWSKEPGVGRQSRF